MVDEMISEGGAGGAGSPGSPGEPGNGGTGGTGGHGGVGVRGPKGVSGDKGVSGEDTFMNQSLWLGFRRWTWIRIAFVGLCLMTSYGFYREHQFEAREDAEEAQEIVDKDYNTCVRGNDTRQVIMEVIQLTGGPTDLTVIPGFEDLTSETQAFLVSLKEVTTAQAEGEESFKAEAQKILAIRDCDAEFPNATGATDE